jgi:3-hydroxyacyl-CoA dehydrogenase
MSIGLGKLANSPSEAASLAMSRQSDVFHMNRDHMLNLSLSSLEKVKKSIDRESITLSGVDQFQEMVDWLESNHAKETLTAHDVTVGTEIARIVTGGECPTGTVFSEQDILNAERASFIRLARTAETQARIVAMLDNGKTLRN